MVVEFFYVWKIVYILMKYFFFDEYLFLIFKIKIFIIIIWILDIESIEINFSFY